MRRGRVSMSTMSGFDVFDVGQSNEMIGEFALVPHAELAAGSKLIVQLPIMIGGTAVTVELTVDEAIAAGQPVLLDVNSGAFSVHGNRSVSPSWTLIDAARVSIETAELAELSQASAPLQASPVEVPEALSAAAVEGGVEIVFVDGNIHQADQLIDGIDGSYEVYVVEPGVDGVAFMASVLEGRSGVDAIHVISHGSDGEFRLGSSFVDQTNIEGQYAAALSSIGNALSENADFLIYGCDFGADSSAVAALAAATGADVAASNDLTGHASLGADWDLEVQTGTIEAGFPITAQLQEEWAGILGNFSLNWNNVVWTDGQVQRTYTLTSTTGQR